MWSRYVVRELSRRRRQAVAVIAGLGVAVAVVVVIGGVGTGLRTAQDHALSSLYGVGIDVTITHVAAPGTAGPQFSFSSGSTVLAQSKVSVARGIAAYDATQVAIAAAVPGVTAATGVLRLDNYDFSGVVPGTTPALGGETGGGSAEAAGSSFGIDSFTVSGVDVMAGNGVGLLANAKITAGRNFSAADAIQRVTLVDTAYATENQITVGSPLSIGGIDIPVIGLVSSAAAGVSTGSNAYLPLQAAQDLGAAPAKITHIYVKAASAADIPKVTKALQAALPDDIVSTQADLANTVSGSLSAASDLSTTLGGWLSAIALAAATLFAALFTVVGVSRRTREFGTLKALGWRTRQVISQVIGETFVQGVLGAAVGVALGAAAVAIINATAPQLSANLAANGAVAQIPLVAAFPASTALLAAGLAVIAALLAAVAGGIRVAILRPAEALRSAE